MNSKMNTSILIMTALMCISCNKNPKVITETSEDNDSVKSSGIFSESETPQSDLNVDYNATPFSEGLHKVVVNEVLPTTKYVYLNVNEGDKQFWIATGKMEAKVGDTYFYKGGLLKTNFESKEYNRVFETVYLVTNLVAEQHGNTTDKVNIGEYSEAKQKRPTKVVIETHADKVIQHKGSIKISELVANQKKYEGKTVQLTGTCTKINAGIMNRNWIHLKDGSKDDFDLVITSDAFVPEGSSITIKALVTLDKDFGAGYHYDLILENGVLIK
ncbi:MAG: hypothetical protein V7719_12695 [Psychroserpens sp.]|uniref:hypothetical protein n=1 Tax=Psychroserpens sp. TaxID=2020870 RepID=UPI0030038EA6